MRSLSFRLYSALAGLFLCALLAEVLLLRATSLPTWLNVRTAALLLGGGSLVCGLSLFWLLHKNVWQPLRHLHHELSGALPATAPTQPAPANEVEALARRVRRLYDNMQRTSAQLEESHETLRHTEKLALVGKLAAGVAHSIRNPLTGLKLRVFSLSKGLSLNEKQQQDLHAINDAVRHMESITTNFLEFSRRPRLTKAPVTLSQVVDNTLSLLAPRLQSFQVRVEQHRPDYIPLVDADAEQLREALANLILNACEAMGVGGTLSLIEESGQLAPLGRVAVLRVADTGPGISTELQEAIFQPFISTKAEGTGLGLPIAQRIFEEHGGWLHLHSAPGRGATFVAVLPAHKDEDIWTRS